MGYVDPRDLEHQRKRFTRNNARLYIRHDVERFFLPGCCPEELKPVYPKSATQRRREEEAARIAAKEFEALAREREQLARDIEQERLKIKSEMAWLRFKRAWLLHRIEQQKAFNPNQPRVPAGNSDGGQWTREGSGVAAGFSDEQPDLRRRPATGQTVGVAQLAPSGSTATDVGQEFSSERAGWHDYTAGPNLVCRAELRCSREEMADQLARFSVPGRDPANPAEDFDISLVEDPTTSMPVGWVKTRISDDGLTIINQTTRVHALYDGIVIRSARQGEDGSWYVTTRGFGNNMVPGMNRLNQEQGPPIFDLLDRRLRENIERHRAKGFYPLPEPRVDGSDHRRLGSLLAGPQHVG
jgi:hypothetical protein